MNVGSGTSEGIEPSPKTTRERISEDRRELLEILITAILFGLTLNMLADYIIAALEFIDLQVIGICSSLLLTAFFFYLLVRQYLGDDCKIARKFSAVIIWESSTGEYVELNHLYIPQQIAKMQRSFLDTDERDSTISRFVCDLQKTVEFDCSVLLDIFEDIIKYKLGDQDYFLKHPPPHHIEGLRGLSYIGLNWDLARYRIDKQFRVKAKKTSSRGRALTCSLPNGTITVEISVNLERVMYHQGPSRSEIIVMEGIYPIRVVPEGIKDTDGLATMLLGRCEARMTAEFSSVSLGLRMDKISEQIEWTEDFFEKWIQEFDFDIQRYVAYSFRLGLKQGHDIGKQL